jgi:hypothetical protein
MSDFNKCLVCKHYTPTQIFELCTAPKSKYTVASKDDFHTISHMRLHRCGEAAVLFQSEKT